MRGGAEGDDNFALRRAIGRSPDHFRSALPLIRLPAPSPRNGAGKGRALPPLAVPHRAERQQQQRRGRGSRRTAARGDRLQHAVVGGAQADPVAAGRHRRRRAPARCAGRVTPLPVPASRRTLPPVASATGAQHVVGRDGVGEFRRVDRADMGERGQVAIADLVEADLVGLDAAGEDAGLGRRRAARSASCRTA